MRHETKDEKTNQIVKHQNQIGTASTCVSQHLCLPNVIKEVYNSSVHMHIEQPSYIYIYESRFENIVNINNTQQ